MEAPEMMHIHIDQIPEQGLQLDFAERADVFPVLANMMKTGECGFLSPIKTTLRAIRIGDMVEVEGHLTTVVRLICGRCLIEYSTPLESNYALTYTRLVPGLSEDAEQAEVQLNAADMGLIYFQGEEINLHDGIQEQIVLAFPLNAVCKENCKGLCPICGANLNDGNCNCVPESSDSKFAVLKNLKLNKTDFKR
jgi:uncharacterized protein